MTTYLERIAALSPTTIIANTLASFQAVDAARALDVPSLWIIRESTSPHRFFRYLPRQIQAIGLASIEHATTFVTLADATRRHWPPNTAHVKIGTALSRLQCQRYENGGREARHANR
ncbi:MAG: hypothetical protein HC809_13610 [Gammaproteobacteria bacterium]|nr:hypothetical protein [Gammaproteobacteria bacterium]